jgi:hypothetical protein
MADDDEGKRKPFNARDAIRERLEKFRETTSKLPPGVLENIGHAAGAGLVAALTGKAPDPIEAFARPLYGVFAQRAIEWVQAAPGRRVILEHGAAGAVEVWAEEPGKPRERFNVRDEGDT